MLDGLLFLTLTVWQTRSARVWGHQWKSHRKVTFDFTLRRWARLFQSNQERDRKGPLKQKFYTFVVMKVKCLSCLHRCLMCI